MNESIVYCPVLKGKANDIEAIAKMAATSSSRIKPLFELPPFKPSDRPEDVTARFAARLAASSNKVECFIDFPLLKPGATTSKGENALVAAYGQLNALGIAFTPTLGFDRASISQKVAIDQGRRSGSLLLRLDRDDIEFPEDTLDRIADLRSYGVDFKTLDVMVDLRYLDSRTRTFSLSEQVEEFLSQLNSTVQHGALIVVASSAPKTVAGIEKDSQGEVFRNELLLWCDLSTSRKLSGIRYGDYGVIHPEFSDLTMSTHINGKIRYTSGQYIHIFRGHSLRQGDKYEQYRKLSKAVLDSGHFMGADFSFGDRQTYDCATGLASTGNPGKWVLNDQNHHITYVAQQIARMREVIAEGASLESVLEIV
jgi:uncharacterized protein (UPF0335 family)